MHHGTARPGSPQAWRRSLSRCRPSRPVPAGTTQPHGVRRRPAPSASASLTPPEELLSGLAAKGVAALFTGTYALDSVDPKQADAKVTIYRLDSSYRVDVARKGATSILMTTKDGLVSCQVQGKRRTCLRVGDSAKPPPDLFDPGLQRLFTTDLVALAGVRGSR